jgi:hypothetical protein
MKKQLPLRYTPSCRKNEKDWERIMSDRRNRYCVVKTKLRQLLPEQWERDEAYMTTLSLLVGAIMKAKDLTQHALAAEMPLDVQDTSLAQRQRRWLMNDRMTMQSIYEPLIAPLIRMRSGGRCH